MFSSWILTCVRWDFFNHLLWFSHACDALLMSSSISCVGRWLQIYCRSLLLFPEWWLILITLLSWTSSQAPPRLTPTSLTVLLHKCVFSMIWWFSVSRRLELYVGVLRILILGRYYETERPQVYILERLCNCPLPHPHVLSSFVHMTVKHLPWKIIPNSWKLICISSHSWLQLSFNIRVIFTSS